MYGQELIIDLENANVILFNRFHLDKFLDQLCLILDVDAQERYYWDEEGIPPHERLTDPKHVGTTVIQFLLKSNITVHTLDLLKEVYINIFVCDKFNRSNVVIFCEEFFNANVRNITVLERG